ncbi:MAG: MBL fold metallo-hydrolase [Acidobacteria bacterium]|nr:MBL fold metallo-hydrolase [Acidobacteriota bacterium]
MAISGPVRLTVLGSGTSVGVPTIGCPCAVCHSDDPRDRRQRSSLLVSYESDGRLRNIVIDTTPDFRRQALETGFKTLDAILYTHAHSDHIMGLDDIRPFNYGRTERLPIYGDRDTLEVVQRVFPYAFQEIETHPGGLPRLEANTLGAEPLELFGLEFIPAPIWHGRKRILGYRFGAAAYLTDMSDIPEQTLPLLEGLDVLFVDALRKEPHPSHSTVDQALGWVDRIRPRRAYFTHICHDLPHAETTAALPDGIELAYDGLVVETSGARD